MLAKKPDGWWSIDTTHDAHKGTKEKVLAAIKDAKDIPDEDKTHLTAKVTATKCEALEIHAHFTKEGETQTLSIRINPLF